MSEQAEMQETSMRVEDCVTLWGARHKRTYNAIMITVAIVYFFTSYFIFLAAGMMTGSLFMLIGAFPVFFLAWCFDAVNDVHKISELTGCSYEEALSAYKEMDAQALREMRTLDKLPSEKGDDEDFSVIEGASAIIDFARKQEQAEGESKSKKDDVSHETNDVSPARRISDKKTMELIAVLSAMGPEQEAISSSYAAEVYQAEQSLALLRSIPATSAVSKAITDIEKVLADVPGALEAAIAAQLEIYAENISAAHVGPLTALNEQLSARYSGPSPFDTVDEVN